MSKDKKTKIPGRLMRTLKAGRLTGALSGSYLGGKLIDRFRSEDSRVKAGLERHARNAKRVVETMSELRGPLMKIGQLLSTHGEFLPGEFVDVLGSLQSDVPPMPYETIREQVFAELGQWPEEAFVEFEPEAFAAASMGQVHRAVVEVEEDGEARRVQVAVKIQYPGADAMVEADLKNMEGSIKLIKTVAKDMVGQSRLDFTPVYREVAEHLRQETDYCREAYNAQLMHAVLSDVEGLRVPRVYNAWSSLRMVTYEFIEGEKLSDYLDRDDLTMDDRKRLTKQLALGFWSQIFGNGIMHADPHPGNYLITPEGELALLDFGCVKIFSEAWAEGFIQLLLARIHRDDAAERRAILALEMVDDPDNDDDVEDIRRIGNYFSVGVTQDEEVNLADYDYAARGRELMKHFLTHRRLPKSHQDFIFLTRVSLGLYEYFSRLNAPVNYHRIAMPIIADGWTGRKVPIPDYYLPE